MNKLKESHGTMFHTQLVKQSRKVFCDDDCDWGGCPGHVIDLIVQNTAGVGCIVIDGEELHWMDCNHAQAVYEMMKTLIEENEPH